MNSTITQVTIEFIDDAFLRAAELVVGDGDRTGQADARLIFFGEAEDR